MNLNLGATDPQVHALGVGVGEVIQGAHTVGDGEPARCQERTDLADRAGDGGAVHALHLRRRSVGKRQPHHDQSDQYLVDEDESVVGPGSGGTPTLTAAPFLQRRLVRGLPLRGDLFDQLAKTCTGDTGQGGMGRGGTRLVDRRG
ncbi:hypothetical protein [Streptomyces sp. NBC_00154]|uniref:hypothetical protein n=1 Tax=Streptomyces sp. NBC_00154 TaxID=2975670 RepID=UPI0022567C42|nr:hypothetical protein [Streptomyces sp. NBC_00154]MCX5316983.1 hypothetical protein [Streptomyces sp. NBC_00154]